MVHTATPVHSNLDKGAARWWRALWLVWVVVAWAALPSLAQRLTWLDTLDGRGSYALVIFLPPLTRTFGIRRSRWGYATGVSADGSVVVGVAYYAAGYGRAFRWTAARGMQDLGTLGGSWSVAWGVSADGSVVVGVAENAAGQPCLSLDGGGGMQDLGTLGGRWSEAWGVSADGSVVVGWLRTPQGSGVPFAGRRRVGCKTSARWAAVGARLLAFPPMAPWWSAEARNAAGQVVPFAGRRRVGWKTSARWAAIERANGVSADGSVVVGEAENAEGQTRAFRWTAARGMQDLGTLGGR
jgi:probable HAF family extracellular repeat protein